MNAPVVTLGTAGRAMGQGTPQSQCGGPGGMRPNATSSVTLA